MFWLSLPLESKGSSVNKGMPFLLFPLIHVVPGTQWVLKKYLLNK